MQIISNQLNDDRAPTAGGQYHWVSEFSPKKAHRFLSYLVGWLCVLVWQAGAASSAFLAGTEIQGLIVLNHPDYVFKRWHRTLFVTAVILISSLFNTVLARRLPLVEKGILILHFVEFLAIMIPLVILAPKSTSHEVFTTFHDGGWGSTGLSCLVGIIFPVLSLLGADAAAHMSEEVKDASRTIPIAMITSLAVNGSCPFSVLSRTWHQLLVNYLHLLAIMEFCSRDFSLRYVSSRKFTGAYADDILGFQEVANSPQLCDRHNSHLYPPFYDQHWFSHHIHPNHVAGTYRVALLVPHLDSMRITQAIAQRASPQAEFRPRKSRIGGQYLRDSVLAPNTRYVVSIYFVFMDKEC
jgi:hypothetical protein